MCHSYGSYIYLHQVIMDMTGGKLITWMITLGSLYHCSGSQTDPLCDEYTSSGGVVRVDCSNRKLTTVPQDLPENIAILHINGNNISAIKNSDFSKYIYLSEVRMSFNVIESLQQDSFNNLTELEILDLSANKIHFRSADFPGGLFQQNDKLHTLLLAGQFVDKSKMSYPAEILTSLTNLKRLSWSPMDRLPNVSHLPPNLEVLDFQWGDLSSSRLTRSMLSQFTNTSIRELSFYNCDIRYVENGTFDNLVHLELVNMACNHYLVPDMVIDSLSTSVNHSVDSLILDGTNTNSMAGWMLGRRDRHRCRTILGKLTRLSIRATDIRRITSNMSHCFQNLKQFSVSYNAPVFAGRSYDWLKFLDLFPKYLLSLDADYLLNYNLFHIEQTCMKSTGILPGQNKDYFLPVISNEKCDPMSARYNPDEEVYANYKFDSKITKKCIMFPFKASCVQNMDVSHFNLLRYGPKMGCVHLPSFGNLRKLNVSHCVECTARVEGPIYGLDQLGLLDMSYWKLSYFNFSIISNMPLLKYLHLEGNKFGEHKLEDFPKHAHLQELYLDENMIKTIPETVFVNLQHLRVLSLRNNEISSPTFITSQLKYLTHLDLSNNKLSHIPEAVTTILDQTSLNSNISLDISQNQLQCGCVDLEFIKWIQTSNVVITLRDILPCLDGEDPKIIMNINLTKLHYKCQNLYEIISASIAVPSVLLTLCILCYNYRWTIKWKFYILKRMFNSVQPRHDMTACVIHAANYPDDDEFASNWVRMQLRPLVEDEWQLKLWYYERDADFGGEQMLNMVGGIRKCRAAIWIVTPSFLKNSLCINSANFAVLHYGARNNLMVQFSERPIELSKVTKGLVHLFDSKLGISRAKFSPRDHENRYFREKLQQFLLEDDDVTPGEDNQNTGQRELDILI